MLYWGESKRFLARLWSDECGISSVEYALLLSFIGGGIMMSVEFLSDSVSNQMNDTAALFDGDGSGGEGGAANCGSSGGEGAGSGNTCE